MQQQKFAVGESPIDCSKFVLLEKQPCFNLIKQSGGKKGRAWRRQLFIETIKKKCRKFILRHFFPVYVVHGYPITLWHRPF
jgi:hypothetical protein